MKSAPRLAYRPTMLACVVLALAGYGAANAAEPMQRHTPGFDHVGVATMPRAPGPDAPYAYEYSRPQSVSAGKATAAKHLEMRKSDLARRMFWIMLSMR